MKRAQDDLAGTIFKDKYKLESLVGEGGMAYVYRGVHMDFDHPIAFKVLFSHFASKDNIRERFKREAVLQFRLQHANIVRVIDMIEEDGMLGIFLDWVDGSDLEVFLQGLQRPATLLEIRRLFMPILQAVGYAHDQKIVHRDLKPSNVLLAGEAGHEIPKVMDFGIAKSLGDDNFKTRTGVMVGTPYYISPEQAQGMKSVDHRTDIYSLGVTLFQMLTGRVPFEGQNALEVVAKHCFTETPSLLEFRPDLPPAFEEIINQAMAKDPIARFRSARAFARKLDELLPAYEGPVLSQDEMPAVPTYAPDATALGHPPVPSGWHFPSSTEVAPSSGLPPTADRLSSSEPPTGSLALPSGLPSAAELIPSSYADATRIESSSGIDGLPNKRPPSPLPSALDAVPVTHHPQTDSGETHVATLDPAAVSNPGSYAPLPTGDHWGGYTTESPALDPSLSSQEHSSHPPGEHSSYPPGEHSSHPPGEHSLEVERDITPPYSRPLPLGYTPPSMSLPTSTLEGAEQPGASTPYWKTDLTVVEPHLTQPVVKQPSERPTHTIWMFLTIGLVSGLAIFSLLTWLQSTRQKQGVTPLSKVQNRRFVVAPTQRGRESVPPQPIRRAALVVPSRPMARRVRTPAPVQRVVVQRIPRHVRAVKTRRVKQRQKVRRRSRSKQRSRRSRRSRVSRLPSRPPHATWTSCRLCVYRRWGKVTDEALMEQRPVSCNRGDVLEIGQYCARQCGYYYINFCMALMQQSDRKCRVWLGSVSLSRSRSLRSYQRTFSPAVVQRCIK